MLVLKLLFKILLIKFGLEQMIFFTIEEAQKQLGKEDKEKTSKSISENAKETNFNYITNTLNSRNSNISETYSTVIHNDFIYDTKIFYSKFRNFFCFVFFV